MEGVRLKSDSASGYRFIAIATLSAAAAGITFLAGLVDVQLNPLIALRPLPDADWSQVWSPNAISATHVQAAAIDEWMRAVLGLLAVILIIAGANALVSLFAHASTRRYEVALAAVVGASRRQLARDQLKHAALNAGAALGLGVSAGLAAGWVGQLLWPHIPRGLAAAAWIAASVLFCATLTGLVVYQVTARM